MTEQVWIAGGCHCGTVRFKARVPERVTVLDCNCSICAKTGFRHLIVPHEDFTLLQGREALTSYRFGTGAAEHLFCGTCGVKSFYQPRSHPDCWSINLNAIDDPTLLEIAAKAFDGRNWEVTSSTHPPDAAENVRGTFPPGSPSATLD